MVPVANEYWRKGVECHHAIRRLRLKIRKLKRKQDEERAQKIYEASKHVFDLVKQGVKKEEILKQEKEHAQALHALHKRYEVEIQALEDQIKKACRQRNILFDKMYAEMDERHEKARKDRVKKVEESA
jgi:hypothetical protein